MEPGGSGVTITSLDFLAASIHARNYTIFYRIYISSQGFAIIDTTDSMLADINPALLSDFRAIFPYADPIETDINTTGVGSLFARRGYFELYVVSNIGDVPREIGDLLNIDFPDGISIHFPAPGTGAPFLEADGVQYTLIRSNGGGSFSPQPIDRLFLNHEDLNNNDNANPTEMLNRDTARYRYPNPQAPIRFTYVSMYIATIGFDPTTFVSVFSKPTHLGIFMLPLP